MSKMQITSTPEISSSVNARESTNKSKRYCKACSHCQRSKLKCRRSLNASWCERCRELNLQCYIQERTPPKSWSKERDEKIQQLYDRLNNIERLLKDLAIRESISINLPIKSSISHEERTITSNAESYHSEPEKFEPQLQKALPFDFNVQLGRSEELLRCFSEIENQNECNQTYTFSPNIAYGTSFGQSHDFVPVGIANDIEIAGSSSQGNSLFECLHYIPQTGFSNELCFTKASRIKDHVEFFESFTT